MVLSPRSATPSRTVLLAALLDGTAVVAFAATGRATHAGDILGPGGMGLATAAWPFAVALLLGWLATRAWRFPLSPLRAGLGVWGATLVLGMLLRTASGQGTAPAFVVVAAVTLLILLLGWRLIATAVGKLSRRGER